MEKAFTEEEKIKIKEDIMEMALDFFHENGKILQYFRTDKKSRDQLIKKIVDIIVVILSIVELTVSLVLLKNIRKKSISVIKN